MTNETEKRSEDVKPLTVAERKASMRKRALLIYVPFAMLLFVFSRGVMPAEGVNYLDLFILPGDVMAGLMAFGVLVFGFSDLAEAGAFERDKASQSV